MLRPVDTIDAKQSPANETSLTISPAQPEKVAVLLNRNARLVTDKLVRQMERLVGSEHVYYSRDLDEAEAFTREIIQKGYGTIACGGGDGTLCGTINFVRRYIDEANAWREERFSRFGEKQELIACPRFVFLKLGTGNGIAPVVGATHPLRDLRKVIEYTPSRAHQVPMLEVEGEKCFVAGLGYDSQILADYNWMKNNTNNWLLKGLMHSVVGYLAASVTRTVPRALFGDTRLRAKVVTRGRAYYVDPRRGDSVEEIAPGTTIFEGPASFIGAGTMPYFGYRFRAFPFSNIMPGMMNLRIATIGPLSALYNLVGLWRGTHRSSRALKDFLVEDVSIELENPFPFQHSGDPQGMRKRVDIKVSNEPLQLVDFHRPRMIS